MTKTIAPIDEALATVAESVARLGIANDIRSHTQAIASMLAAVRSLGRAATGQGTGKSAILDYFVSNVGIVVNGSELEAASGIAEYSRRIRELRAEGWRIIGGATGPTTYERRLQRRLNLDHIGPSDYVLLSTKQKRTPYGGAAGHAYILAA